MNGLHGSSRPHRPAPTNSLPTWPPRRYLPYRYFVWYNGLLLPSTARLTWPRFSCLAFSGRSNKHQVVESRCGTTSRQVYGKNCCKSYRPASPYEFSPWLPITSPPISEKHATSPLCLPTRKRRFRRKPRLWTVPSLPSPRASCVVTAATTKKLSMFLNND